MKTLFSIAFLLVVFFHAADCRRRRPSHRPWYLRMFSSPSSKCPTGIVRATCLFRNNEVSSINGRIDFSQSVDSRCIPNDELEIRVRIEGLNSADGIVDHGLHIHQFGDLDSNCLSTGPHYNPFNRGHGGRRSDPRHHGDLGNVREDADGRITDSFQVPQTAIIGPRSVIGRAVVLHALQDDLGVLNNEGSRATGNSGSRRACCVIGRSDPNTNN